MAEPPRERKRSTNPGEGRPPHVPTDKNRGIVETMVAVGIPEVEIGLVIGISHVTLRKYYQPEIDTGAAKANAQVGRTWFMRATGGGDWQKASDTALIWWTKTRMGAKEPKQEVILGGDPANPIGVQRIERVIVDPSD